MKTPTEELHEIESQLKYAIKKVDRWTRFRDKMIEEKEKLEKEIFG